MPNPDQLRVLNTQIAPAAVACEEQLKVPAEVSAGQCILEASTPPANGLPSIWLASMPLVSNNPFGIKARLTGDSGIWRLAELAVLSITHEMFTEAQLDQFLRVGLQRTAVLDPPQQQPAPVLRYRVKDWFTKYESLSAAFIAHGQLLTEGPYLMALQQFLVSKNLPVYIAAIAKHYATDPNYAKDLTEIAMEPAVMEACAAVRLATRGY